MFVERRLDSSFGLRMFRFSPHSALGGVLGKVRQSLAFVHTAPSGQVVSCAELIGRLEPLNRTGIATIALAFLVPSPCHMDPRCEDRLLPADIWELAGGIGGVLLMERNVDVILKLAEAAQQWNSEAEIVYERLRLDAKTLHRHLRRMRFAEFCPSSAVRVPFHLQSAVTLYYLMAKRLLALYEVSHSGLFPALQKVL